VVHEGDHPLWRRVSHALRRMVRRSSGDFRSHIAFRPARRFAGSALAAVRGPTPSYAQWQFWHMMCRNQSQKWCTQALRRPLPWVRSVRPAAQLRIAEGERAWPANRAPARDGLSGSAVRAAVTSMPLRQQRVPDRSGCQLPGAGSLLSSGYRFSREGHHDLAGSRTYASEKRSGQSEGHRFRQRTPPEDDATMMRTSSNDSCSLNLPVSIHAALHWA